MYSYFIKAVLLALNKFIINNRLSEIGKEPLFFDNRLNILKDLLDIGDFGRFVQILNGHEFE